MPVRKARKPDDLRRAVLDASVRVIATEGVEALSLRDVARRAGVTHGAPYHYFRDKDALLDALADEGFLALRDAMRAAAAGVDSAQEKFAAIGRAYVGFAVENPGHFHVMFRPGTRPRGSGPPGDNAFDVLVQTLARAQGEGAAPPEPAGALVLLAWSAVHGLASLWVDGALRQSPLTLAGIAEAGGRMTALLAELYAAAARPGRGRRS